MHVLHLLYEPARSGISRHVLGVVRLLPELRHGVIYPARLTGLAEELAAAGAEPWPVAMSNKALPRATWRALPRLVRRLRPDVLHLHALEAGFFGSLVARAAGQRGVVFTPQTIDIRQRYLLPAYRSALRAAARPGLLWLAVSEGQVEGLRRLAGQAEVRCVPNWAPERPPLPPRAEARARLGWDPEAFVVAQLSRLSAQKDPLTFVRAAALDRGGRWKLCGEGPQRGEVEAAARGIDALQVCGQVDDQDVFAAADVITLASLWEGLSFALLGAMQAGRVVVASRIPGNTDLVAHEVSGLLVEPSDPVGLQAAVGRLRDDPELAARLAAAGRARIEARYSAAVVAERLRAVYREASASV